MSSDLTTQKYRYLFAGISSSPRNITADLTLSSSVTTRHNSNKFGSALAAPSVTNPREHNIF